MPEEGLKTFHKAFREWASPAIIPGAKAFSRILKKDAGPLGPFQHGRRSRQGNLCAYRGILQHEAGAKSAGIFESDRIAGSMVQEQLGSCCFLSIKVLTTQTVFRLTGTPRAVPFPDSSPPYNDWDFFFSLRPKKPISCGSTLSNDVPHPRQ